MRNWIIFFIAFFTFVSCSENDHNENQQESSKPDLSLITGEWVSANNSQSLFVDLTLSQNYRVEYSIIQNEVGNLSVIKKDEGSWSWSLYKNKQTLLFSMLYQVVPLQEIMELDNDHMLLRNQSFNTTDSYYRVVETLHVCAGQEASITYLNEHRDFSVSKSTNPNIASVNSSGIVTASQGGTAFVLLESGEKKAYVKIVVTGRMDRFAAEVHLTVDDILDMYGEPDFSGKREKEGGLVYNQDGIDSGLKQVQYTYGLDNKEIKSILTIYPSYEETLSDRNILHLYYKRITSLKGNSYGLSDVLWDNSYIVTVYDSEPLYMQYLNLDYSGYDSAY